MNANDLILRRNRILASVVRLYVTTGEPVSSSTICRKERTGLSPATIRNVLADLEKLDLVWQPHTSSGRIPTEKGYRYYVNSLMTAWRLTDREKKEVDKTYSNRREHLETVIEKTSRLLSSITRHIGVILFPSFRTSVFRQMKMIPMQGRRILVVMVTGTGMVSSSLVESEERVTDAELEKIVRFINSEFSGLTVTRIKERLKPALLEENDPFLYLRTRANQIISRSRLLTREEHVCLYGAGHITRHPEFRDVDRLKKVLELLDDKDKLCRILSRDFDSEGVVVRIGRENEFERMRDCSVVISSYRARKNAIGSLGVFGPTRMAYEQVTSFVDYVAEALSEFIRENE